jgi:LysM repeat protein
MHHLIHLVLLPLLATACSLEAPKSDCEVYQDSTNLFRAIIRETTQLGLDVTYSVEIVEVIKSGEILSAPGFEDSLIVGDRIDLISSLPDPNLDPGFCETGVLLLTEGVEYLFNGMQVRSAFSTTFGTWEDLGAEGQATVYECGQVDETTTTVHENTETMTETHPAVTETISETEPTETQTTTESHPTETNTPPSGPRHPASCDGQEIHCVKSGDTLSKISDQYKLDLVKLEAANPQFEDNYDLIYPGDKVCIPESCYPSRKPAKCDGEILTKVVGGDTLFKLALANDLELQDLIDANSQLGPDYDLIFPGDQVCKPKDCGKWDVEAVHEEPTYEVVVEYTKDGTADTGSDVDSENGYTTKSSFLTSSASSMVASIILVLGAVGMFAI